jgi:hypothetical protein
MLAEHLVYGAVCVFVPCGLGGKLDQVGAQGLLQR